MVLGPIRHDDTMDSHSGRRRRFYAAATRLSVVAWSDVPGSRRSNVSGIDPASLGSASLGSQVSTLWERAAAPGDQATTDLPNDHGSFSCSGAGIPNVVPRAFFLDCWGSFDRLRL